MRRLPTLLLPALAALLAWTAPAAAQISVDSLIVTLEPAAGGASLVIPVANEGELGTSVRVEVQDWEIDAAGEHRFVANGTTPASCGGRLRVSEAAFELMPGAVHELRVFHDGPADDRCRNIIFLRASDLDTVLNGEPVTLVISTGVKVFVERR
jgi:P pilus assembly chaperone PapD